MAGQDLDLVAGGLSRLRPLRQEALTPWNVAIRELRTVHYLSLIG